MNVFRRKIHRTSIVHNFTARPQHSSDGINTHCTHQNDNYVRLFSEKNILDFKSKLNNINWDPNNVNFGYDYFDSKIKECYNSSFKLVRLSRKRSKDKMWITPGLKCSINRKNKLFKKWMTTLSKKDEEKYKYCRTQYNKIVSEAEKSYRISSNRSRALNTSRASNTGRGADVIVLIEAGP